MDGASHIQAPGYHAGLDAEAPGKPRDQPIGGQISEAGSTGGASPCGSVPFLCTEPAEFYEITEISVLSEAAGGSVWSRRRAA